MNDLDTAVLAYRASPQSPEDLERALAVQRAALNALHKRQIAEITGRAK